MSAIAISRRNSIGTMIMDGSITFLSLDPDLKIGWHV